MAAPFLRPYQQRTTDAVVRAFFEHRQNRLLVKKPTGTGKTVWFASLLEDPRIKTWLETFPKNERRMLVIAHREELLFQAAEKIQKANPNLIVSIEQGDLHASVLSDVVIASIQTLSAMKFRRLHRLLARHTFRLVVVDEAHHAAAATYRTTLVHLGFLPKADASETEDIEAADFDDVAVMNKALESWDQEAPKDRLLIGVTATPNRSDAIGLGCVFQTIAYSYDLRLAITDGWLVPIVPWTVQTVTSLDNVHISHGDFKQNELAEAVNNPQRNAQAAAAWQQYATGLSAIAFTVDVQHAHDLAAAFNAVGARARAISGETPKDERREVLRAYTRGDVDVITNCMVLTEGTDLPRTACIIHCKPTKSATLYEQMTGRGLRVHPDDPAGPARLTYKGRLLKDACIVIDLADIARKHSLQNAPVLYGLPPGLDSKGKDLKDLAQEWDAFRELYPNFDLDAAFKEGPRTLAQLGAMAKTFDPWSIPSLGSFGTDRALVWIRAGEDRFMLSYPWADGTETIVVEKDLIGKWWVSATLRPRGIGGIPRQRTLASDIINAEEAGRLAETFVQNERRTVARMKDANAAWRKYKPSTNQLGLMQKLGIPFRPKMTSGDASNLIDLAIARKGRR